MREKEEREALGGFGTSKGTQSERNGKGSGSRISFHHLDQTTTSFFFTNFTDEVQRVELCEIFAKFGRVGEVFIPKKLTKWERDLVL